MHACDGQHMCWPGSATCGAAFRAVHAPLGEPEHARVRSFEKSSYEESGSRVKRDKDAVSEVCFAHE
jgi:hypothetical protein